MICQVTLSLLLAQFKEGLPEAVAVGGIPGIPGTGDRSAKTK